MKGKVLVNIFSAQVKNDLLSILLTNDYEVLEATSEHDLLFKYGLVKDSLEIYVHELNESNYEASLDQVKRIDTEKIKTVMMIHAYSSKVIDDALALKVNDVIVLPIKRENLIKKLVSKKPQITRTALMPKEPPKVMEAKIGPEPLSVRPVEELFDDSVLAMELNRSTRGRYPLSLVMVTYSNLSLEAFDSFEDVLRKLLRTTDVILRYEQEAILIVCPFTSKHHLVEVENKVREAYGTLTEQGINKGNMDLYGVSYPSDAATKEELIKILKDGIHDSKLLSDLEGPFNELNAEEVRARLKRNYG